MEHITWEQRRPGVHYGSVAGVRFFTIGWGTTGNDAAPWEVSTDLPMSFRSVPNSHATIEEAKAMAEEVMTGFLTKIGAEWTDRDSWHTGLDASWYLAQHHISWQDPKCGCLRSPDALLLSPCPEHG